MSESEREERKNVIVEDTEEYKTSQFSKEDDDERMPF